MSFSNEHSEGIAKFEICLDDVILSGYHGVMAQERLVGNKFIVSLKISVALSEHAVLTDSIDSTISYADLYEIIKSEFETPSNLLETVAIRIKQSLLRVYPQIDGGEITITKVAVPIPGFNGTAKVCLKF